MNQAVATERDLVIKFRDAKRKKADLELQLAEAQKSLDSAELALIELLESGDKKSSAKYEGIGFVTIKKPRLYASCDKEHELELFEFLKSEGRADLIKTAVNSQSLSSFVGERLENGKSVPEFIKQFFKTSLQLTEPK